MCVWGGVGGLTGTANIRARPAHGSHRPDPPRHPSPQDTNTHALYLEVVIHGGQQRGGHVRTPIHSSVHFDERLSAHLVLHSWVVQVSVEHDEGKGKDVGRVWVSKRLGETQERQEKQHKRR